MASTGTDRPGPGPTGEDAVPGPGFRYGGAPGRQSVILRALRRTGYVSYARLSDELAVSDRTVRRDLAELAARGVVDLVAGGATRPPGSTVGFDTLRGPVGTGVSPAGRRLALAAASLVEAGSVVAIDGGVLAPLLAASLPERVPLTVITPSVDALQVLASREDTTLIGVGGTYDPTRRAFLGPTARTSIDGLRATVAFVLATGVDAGGVLGDDERSVEITRALLGIAARTVLVCESGAAGRAAPVRVCDLGALDALVTDEAVPAELRTALDAHGVELVLG